MGEMTGRGASALLYTQEGLLYLAKRLAKDRPYLGQYAPPGGSVEEMEVPREAVAREVLEECGLTIDKDRFEFLEHTGPHITPVEEGGSGTPFDMYWFAVQVTDEERPKCTEPHRQGEWTLVDPRTTMPSLSKGTENAINTLRKRWRHG